jgi:hypothetical protein
MNAHAGSKVLHKLADRNDHTQIRTKIPTNTLTCTHWALAQTFSQHVITTVDFPFSDVDNAPNTAQHMVDFPSVSARVGSTSVSTSSS